MNNPREIPASLQQLEGRFGDAVRHIWSTVQSSEERERLLRGVLGDDRYEELMGEWHMTAQDVVLNNYSNSVYGREQYQILQSIRQSMINSTNHSISMENRMQALELQNAAMREAIVRIDRTVESASGLEEQIANGINPRLDAIERVCTANREALTLIARHIESSTREEEAQVGETETPIVEQLQAIEGLLHEIRMNHFTSDDLQALNRRLAGMERCINQNRSLYGTNLVNYANGRSFQHMKDQGCDFKHGGNGLRILPSLGNDSRVTDFFVTSYDWCSRTVYIDFQEKGYPTSVFDEMRPKIIVRELACGKKDCACVYELYAKLLTEDEDRSDFVAPFDQTTSTQKFCKKSWPQWSVEDEQWEQVALEFSHYPPGIRALAVQSRGKDTQFWNGHFGSRFANLEVIIESPKS